ncbi:MAG: phenylalanine--tRNA ligase subunit beta, partial [Halioglobus sp.]|nr:phenylalanine--tRNA ligase subunit beta [Halioglobus sp.]
NRADCLGLRGLAREVGLLNQAPVCEPDYAPVETTLADNLAVELKAPECCPRYVGRVIRGIDASVASPLWLREKLRRSGLRSIDPVVDVTNYILLELGQPMHAFDLDKLQGGVAVRRALVGESIELLDGQTVELQADTLVIADDSGPVAMAGIMGGRSTAVSAETCNVFLEAAFFTPLQLAGRARAYGLHTDSSHRFERGVDFAGQLAAMQRATRLLMDIVGGEAGPITEVVVDEHLPQTPQVILREQRIPRLLGMALEPAEVERILTGLGLGVARTDEGWRCSVPSWRFDISIEADLLEELARVYGYNRLPASAVRARLHMAERNESRLPLRELRRHLAARGYREAITYSFVEPSLQQRFDPDVSPVALSNPISSDMAVMRTSLLPGLVSAVLHNVNRQQSRVRLFESGLRFVPGPGGLAQVPTLAFVACGTRFAEAWSVAADGVDFFDVKGDLESVLALSREPQAFAFAATERHGLHPGQTAELTRKGQRVGVIGALHPGLVSELGLDIPLYCCEVDLDAVLERRLPAFTELSKYPGVRRDLSFVVDSSLPVATIMQEVRSVAGGYLTDLTLFDVYTGKGIDPKRKSVSLGLTFRDQSRTLGDDEVNPAVGQVIDLLEKNYNAELRN